MFEILEYVLWIIKQILKIRDIYSLLQSQITDKSFLNYIWYKTNGIITKIYKSIRFTN